MIDALKKELGEMLTDDEYISGITDVLAEQMIRSLEKSAKAWFNRHKKKLILIGGAALIIAIMRRK